MLADILTLKAARVSKPGLSAQIRSAHRDIHFVGAAAQLHEAARSIGEGRS